MKKKALSLVLASAMVASLVGCGSSAETEEIRIAEHKNMSQLADSEKETELMKVHEKVKNLCGQSVTLIRFVIHNFIIRNV